MEMEQLKNLNSWLNTCHSTGKKKLLQYIHFMSFAGYSPHPHVIAPPAFQLHELFKIIEVNIAIKQGERPWLVADAWQDQDGGWRLCVI